ncbi:MAG: ankyrin repeat domain-containing protein [Gammaproteobacteria bacterium]
MTEISNNNTSTSLLAAMSPLSMRALIEQGLFAMVEARLQEDYPINEWMSEDELYPHMTPIHFAAFVGAHDILRLFILCGAEVNAKVQDGNETPLYFAMEEKHYSSATVLLRVGAVLPDQTMAYLNRNKQDLFNQLALCGELDWIRFSIELLGLSPEDVDWLEWSKVAIENSQYELVEFLYEELAPQQGVQMSRDLSQLPVIDGKDWLMWAASENDFELVKTLIEVVKVLYYSDMNQIRTPDTDDTPIYWAIHP